MRGWPPSKRFDRTSRRSQECVTKDFEELLACCNAHGVKALIVGGHAVAFHGKPRFTKDLDLFVESSDENAARLLLALTAFGFAGLGLSVDDFTSPDKVVQLGVAPNRVDLVTSIDGVTFAEAWNGRSAGHYGTEPASYIGKPELLRNKRAVGRPQDLADIDSLS